MMMNRKPQRRFDYLTIFYEHLQNDREEEIKKMEIPMSDLFYCRAALEQEFPNEDFSDLKKLERLLNDEFHESNDGSQKGR